MQARPCFCAGALRCGRDFGFDPGPSWRAGAHVRGPRGSAAAREPELLFTPAINQDIHSLFLRQISEADPGSLHVVVMDQAGFYMKQGDARVPENIRILPLPP